MNNSNLGLDQNQTLCGVKTQDLQNQGVDHVSVPRGVGKTSGIPSIYQVMSCSKWSRETFLSNVPPQILSRYEILQLLDYHFYGHLVQKTVEKH